MKAPKISKNVRKSYDRDIFYRQNREGEFEPVGWETPKFLSDGVWIVEGNTGTKQKIAKIGAFKNPINYASLVKENCEILPKFIRALVTKYTSDTIKFLKDGTIQFVFPSATEFSEEILDFLPRTQGEKQRKIKDVANTVKQIQSDGSVTNALGEMLYYPHSAEATAIKIAQLKEELAYHEHILEQRLMDKL